MAKHHSGDYYIRVAEKNNLDVEMGKGDHCKVKCKNSMMVVPLHRELSYGTECAIKKWFLKVAGIILGIAIIGGCIFTFYYVQFLWPGYG